MCFNISMKVGKLEEISFKSISEQSPHKKREFIDVISESVMNPRDVNDCVAVPRGIFKAYLLIMSGTALLTLSNLVKGIKPFGKFAKNAMIISGWVLNTLSALYFAKPFAFKGQSPTVKREDVNN